MEKENVEKKKMGFFKKIALAITDFRFYPLILKSESSTRSFGHFFMFLMLLTLIISVKMADTMFVKFNYFLEQYEDLVPEFSLSEGVLDVEFDGTKEIRNDMIAVIDTDYTYAECVDASEYEGVSKYDNILMINSDAITLIDSYGMAYQADLSMINDAFDKTSFLAYIERTSDTFGAKMFALSVIFIAVFFVYAIYKFIEVLFFGILAMFISVLAGIRINFKAQMKIVYYAVTLPYIVETIAIVYTGSLKEYAVLASGILAYVYIFYAIRAIKLDMLLMIMNNDKKGAFKLKVDEEGRYECKKIENQNDEKLNEDVSEVAKEIEEKAEGHETTHENNGEENK